nr:type 2 lanthipeptide synthetase LanM [Methylobacterium sp. Leaf122]
MSRSLQSFLLEGAEPHWGYDSRKVDRNLEDLVFSEIYIQPVEQYTKEVLDSVICRDLVGAGIIEISAILSCRLGLAKMVEALVIQWLRKAWKEYKAAARETETRGTDYETFCNLLIFENTSEFSSLGAFLRLRVGRSARMWASAMLIFLSRLQKDIYKINNMFVSSGSAGPVIHIEGFLSDPHEFNQTVLCLTFHSGEKVIYKPRSVRGEFIYNAIAEYVERAASICIQSRFWVIDAGEYGWCEFVYARDGSCAAVAAEFYERCGALLALMWLLGATDLHKDNLLAVGSVPCVIDSEGLFQPLKNSGSLINQIRRTGLVGLSMQKSTGDIEDLSGLALYKTNFTYRRLVTVDAKEDDMRFRFKVCLGPAKLTNVFCSAGNRLYGGDYTDDVLRGFTSMLKFVKYDSNMCSKSSFIKDLSFGFLPRVFLRPTAHYLRLARNLNPHLVGQEEYPEGSKPSRVPDCVGEAEAYDAAVGDVPCFRVSMNDNKLLWRGSCLSGRYGGLDSWSSFLGRVQMCHTDLSSSLTDACHRALRAEISALGSVRP